MIYQKSSAFPGGCLLRLTIAANVAGAGTAICAGWKFRT
jgi:hypothetical protein